jgi:hypothetical protein
MDGDTSDVALTTLSLLVVADDARVTLDDDVFDC